MGVRQFAYEDWCNRGSVTCSRSAAVRHCGGSAAVGDAPVFSGCPGTAAGHAAVSDGRDLWPLTAAAAAAVSSGGGGSSGGEGGGDSTRTVTVLCSIRASPLATPSLQSAHCCTVCLRPCPLSPPHSPPPATTNRLYSITPSTTFQP